MSQNRKGSLEREQAGQIEIALSIQKDGKRVETVDGQYNLIEFLRGFEVYESISNPCMECRLVLEDSAGILGTLTGSEEFVLNIRSSIKDRTYYFRAYQIQARVRTRQTNETYLVNCVSSEFIINETTNIFGNSEVVFDKKNDASEIVKQLLGKRFINTKKKLFSEETINKQSFVSPNWRAFDLIYWLCQRSIRKSSRKGTLQNGFAFFENALGFNYKSLDSLIEQVVDQDETETNNTSGKLRLYTYNYTPKRMGNQESDQFNIDRIAFPEEKNFLMGLRHGAWSGFSIGFDPTFITRSRMGLSTDLSADAYRYTMSDIWKRMSHLNGGNSVNPQKKMDSTAQSYVNFPKRVRYTMLPNQIFDPKFKNNPQRNYEQLVELQAYQWMRMESLKQCQMTIVVPGNLDLYAGGGVEINIPTTYKDGDTPKRDAKYSGRWLIAAVAHKAVGLNFQTELALMKDSDIKNNHS
ncbi:hypothetical protein SSSM5_016 [Synechococcus phage S-SSM5]|uniref:Uncharacterized protein n=1 Tax=Synechococcus phage S-SSM5 TaxID=445685 RepID=E3SK59_9CAUD|nr:tail protein [Synechococcus phage S-SSM5]ADO98051.1 hypothetical protein SSSM5_016 [Synechococcus phage S-SSM5]